MAENLRDRLQAALGDALKARDKPAVAVLRSALAAIDNAEAVPTAEAPSTSEASSEHLAGTAVGLRATEADREALTAPQLEEIVRAEITDRQDAADTYMRAGHPDRAEELRREADVLSTVLDGSS